MDMTTHPIDIQTKLMTVRLGCSFSFGRVTDKTITNEVNHDKGTDALVTKKALFPKESGKHLRLLQSTLNEFYAYHKKVTMEGVNEGERLLPVVFYLDYEQEFGAYQVLVDEAFAEVVAHWDEDIKLAEPLLNEAFNLNDYPPKEDLRRYLNFHKRYLPLPTAGPLLDAVGSCIQADVDGFMKQAMESALADVNSRMKAGLQRMVDQLSNPKGKVFDSLTENLAELIAFIPSFNVTEDHSLNLLVDEVKTRLLCVGPDDLRKNQDVRKATADAAFDILRRMGG